MFILGKNNEDIITKNKKLKVISTFYFYIILYNSAISTMLFVYS